MLLSRLALLVVAAAAATLTTVDGAPIDGPPIVGRFSQKSAGHASLMRRPRRATAATPGGITRPANAGRTAADAFAARHSARGDGGKSEIAKYPINSPCGYGNNITVTTAVAGFLLWRTAMDVYSNRANETYSENMTLRWVGIADHVCPPAAPRYSDCSSAVTWIYWTIFGTGVDFMNGEAWEAGYTGSLKTHGRLVAAPPSSSNELQIGDLCFYYHPMHHTAIYVGEGKVVTHGEDPVGLFPWNYAPVDYCRRYI